MMRPVGLELRLRLELRLGLVLGLGLGLELAHDVAEAVRSAQFRLRSMRGGGRRTDWLHGGACGLGDDPPVGGEGPHAAEGHRGEVRGGGGAEGPRRTEGGGGRGVVDRGITGC